MPQALSYVTLLVRDYDEAIDYFANVLGFSVVADTKLDDKKRWVLVAPAGSSATSLLLAKAATPEQVARIGDQTGGRVSFFLQTDNFPRDYSNFRSRGVKFLETPRVDSLRRPVWSTMGPSSYLQTSTATNGTSCSLTHSLDFPKVAAEG